MIQISDSLSSSLLPFASYRSLVNCFVIRVNIELYQLYQLSPQSHALVLSISIVETIYCLYVLIVSNYFLVMDDNVSFHLVPSFYCLMMMLSSNDKLYFQC